MKQELHTDGIATHALNQDVHAGIQTYHMKCNGNIEDCNLFLAT
jgi:hypothetical protein